jgi:hypothetical protein
MRDAIERRNPESSLIQTEDSSQVYKVIGLDQRFPPRLHLTEGV